MTMETNDLPITWDDPGAEKGSMARHKALKRFIRKVEKEANLLPDLPATGSQLALELHERAQSWLKIRLENVETSVNSLVDALLKKMVDERFMRKVGETVERAIEERVKELLPTLLQHHVDQLPSTISEAQVADWVKDTARRTLESNVNRLANERMKAIAGTEAERLVSRAIEELDRYYGASGLLAEGVTGDHE